MVAANGMRSHDASAVIATGASTGSGGNVVGVGGGGAGSELAAPFEHAASDATIPTIQHAARSVNASRARARR
jgi:hypothetical protein